MQVGKAPGVHEDLVEEAGPTSINADPELLHSTGSGSVAVDYESGPYDFLPSTTTTSTTFLTTSSGRSSTTAAPIASSNSETDCTDTETASSTPCANCVLTGMETGLPDMQGYVPPPSTKNTCPGCLTEGMSSSTMQGIQATASSLPAAASSNWGTMNPVFVTPMGYICRPQIVPTITALGCSVCTTVTETWHSTYQACTATVTSSVTTIFETTTITETTTVTPLSR